MKIGAAVPVAILDVVSSPSDCVRIMAFVGGC